MKVMYNCFFFSLFFWGEGWGALILKFFFFTISLLDLSSIVGLLRVLSSRLLSFVIIRRNFGENS